MMQYPIRWCAVILGGGLLLAAGLLFAACGDEKSKDAPLTVEAYATAACQGSLVAILRDDRATWGRFLEVLNDVSDAVGQLEPPPVLAEWHRWSLLGVRELRGIAASFPAADPITLDPFVTVGLVSLNAEITAIETGLPPLVYAALETGGCVLDEGATGSETLR